jgi:hypothetical protein
MVRQKCSGIRRSYLESSTLSFIFAVIAPTIAVRPRFIQYAARIVSIAPKLFTS